MIVYYQKSTKRILSIVSGKAKNHLNKEQLEAELNSMYPNMKDDVGVMRLEKEEADLKVSCGGIWDEEDKKMSSPPSQAPIKEHPNKDRLNEIFNKWEADPSSATVEEVVEYLMKVGLSRKI